LATIPGIERFALRCAPPLFLPLFFFRP